MLLIVIFAAILFILDIINIICNARRGEETEVGFWFLFWVSYITLVFSLFCLVDFIYLGINDIILFFIDIIIISFAVAFGIIFVNVIHKIYNRAEDLMFEKMKNDKYTKKAENRLEQLTDIE